MIERRRLCLRGVLQGVGFRPFVARLAQRCELGGCVANDDDGVIIGVEGRPDLIERFEQALQTQHPPAALIEHVDRVSVAPIGERTFRIAPSVTDPLPGDVAIAPDRAICDACREEIHTPSVRRFGYAFTTCVDCGPRFSVVTATPYDRARTSMDAFVQCEQCLAEYGAPSDRRHHAQALACPQCGPRVTLLDPSGAPQSHGAEAIDNAAEAVRRGAIVALRGLGGFQLLCDAASQSAVARLRDRKQRPAKPFAVMVCDLEMARRYARLTSADELALTDPAAPIVLVDGVQGMLALSVAPDRTRLGLMLPTTPLHVLLLDQLERPVVATSGNRHEEPIAIDDREAVAHLGPIADLILTHDRPIVRRCDDSVVQVVAGATRVLRLGRGYAPTRLRMPPAVTPILALGGHLKQAPALCHGARAVLWPHVGDLFSPQARQAMVASLDDLESLCRVRASVIAIDAHPDYATSTWAEQCGRRLQRVWHHHAHVAAVMAEHGLSHALGFAWDGVGLGPDGTAWGGEALGVSPQGAKRIAHVRPFRLPGGDAAAREGGRALAGMLAAADLCAEGGDDRLRTLIDVARRPIAPVTTSIGRMFDAVAALTELCPRSRYEGEAAARLEELVRGPLPSPYPYTRNGTDLDWRPTLTEMLTERDDPVRVAGRFHATLVSMLIEIAMEHDLPIALAGGCFQNRVLAEAAIEGLAERGRTAYLPQRVPVSDGGLALGQAWVVSHREPGTLSPPCVSRFQGD